MPKLPGPQDIVRARDYRTHLEASDWNIIKSEITRLVEAHQVPVKPTIVILPVVARVLTTSKTAPTGILNVSFSGFVPPRAKAVILHLLAFTTGDAAAVILIGNSGQFGPGITYQIPAPSKDTYATTAHATFLLNQNNTLNYQFYAASPTTYFYIDLVGYYL